MISNKTKDIKSDHISICICTFKRPEMLAKTLEGVFSQFTDSAFTFEVVIVDNDKMCSAEEIVYKFKDRGRYKVIYDCEPEQSIPLARNRTVGNANGNFIATIDDDEFPTEKWLYNLYRCIKDYNADGVLGPVLPHFPAGALEWLKKSGLCDRPRNRTGSLITGRDLRTGNLLLQRHVFENDNMWFDPVRGLTGGSDGEFLSRQIKRGRKLVWCDEAIVFETVPEERWPAAYYLKRNFRIGTLAGEKLRRLRRLSEALKAVTLVGGYSLLLLLSFLLGKHIWMKVLTKLFYTAGCILSFFGLTDVKHRE